MEAQTYVYTVPATAEDIRQRKYQVGLDVKDLERRANVKVMQGQEYLASKCASARRSSAELTLTDKSMDYRIVAKETHLVGKRSWEASYEIGTLLTYLATIVGTARRRPVPSKA
jgi:hypothetical protein